MVLVEQVVSVHQAPANRVVYRMPLQPVNSMYRIPVQICFRLSAIESMITKILEELDKIGSRELTDLQVAETLRQIQKSVVQTRGRINNRFKSTGPWLGSDIGSADFQSKIRIEGGDVVVADSFDISASLDDLQNQDDDDEYLVADGRQRRGHFVDQSFELDTKDNLSSDCDAKPDDFDLDHVSAAVIGALNGFRDLGGEDGIQQEIKVECNVDAEEEEEELKEYSNRFADINVKDEPNHAPNPKNPQRECDTCGKMVTRSNLFAHRKIHLGEKPHECSVCGKSFSRRLNMKRHMLTHGQKDKDQESGGNPADLQTESSERLQEEGGGTTRDPLRECEICGKMVTRSNIFAHRKIHLGIKPHTCSICGKSFSRKLNMKRHKLTHGQRDKNLCQTCGQCFLDQSGLELHLQEGGCCVDQPPGDCDSGKRFKCEKCNVAFASEDSLREHEKAFEHDKYGCEECGARFSWKRLLEKHVATSHSAASDEKPLVAVSAFKEEPAGTADNNSEQEESRKEKVECEICGKMITRRHLYIHRKQHSGEKPYSCSVCGKRFLRKINMKRHMQIHGPREKILCQTCGRGFLCQKSLKDHLEKGGCDEKDKVKLECKICGKTVKHERYLRSHMMVHSVERPYTCEVCGETFRRPYEINRHKIRRHEQPRCDMCPRSFNSISALNRHHKVVHSDERPFSCDVCGKAYKEKQTLEKHKQIHNKEEHVKCDVCTKSFFFVGDLNRHYQKVHKMELAVK